MVRCTLRGYSDAGITDYQTDVLFSVDYLYRDTSCQSIFEDIRPQGFCAKRVSLAFERVSDQVKNNLLHIVGINEQLSSFFCVIFDGKLLYRQLLSSTTRHLTSSEAFSITGRKTTANSSTYGPNNTGQYRPV